MSKTYTLVDSHTGQVYGRGLDAETAMHEILVHDGNRYKIAEELDSDGGFSCYRLYHSGRPFMALAPTIYFSTSSYYYEAVQEIVEKVLSDSVRAGFPIHAWEDAEWDEIVAP